MRKIIHVNKHVIARNKKHGRNDPAVTVKTLKEGTSTVVLRNEYCHSVDILGPSTMIHSPQKPLSCGARVWIETDAEVVLREDSPEHVTGVECRSEALVG